MAVNDVFQAVLKFNEAAVKKQVQTEIDAGTDIDAILNEGLISSMDDVGAKFSTGELFVPEMLMAAKAMKGGLEILKPHLTVENSQAKGTVIIGTVKGDLHDIGKNLVAMMMEGAGFNVVDLGVDVGPDAFFEAAKEKNADVIALSALLTTTMPVMESVVKTIKDAGLKSKIIIGGAPVTRDYSERIGSDGYSDDAPGSVALIRELLAA